MEECLLKECLPTLLKLALLHGCFLRFLNCTNGTKSRNASHFTDTDDSQDSKVRRGVFLFLSATLTSSRLLRHLFVFIYVRLSTLYI